MPIVAADLKFLSSERMTDEMAGGLLGGGHAVGPVVLTGVANSVFPAAMPADLATGRRQLRQVWPAVLSNENSLASTAQVAVYQRAADANVSLLAFAAAAVAVEARDQRSLPQAANALDYAYLAAAGVYAGTLVSAGGNSLSGLSYSPSDLIKVGEKVGIVTSTLKLAWRNVTAVDGAAGTLTFAGTGLTGLGAGAAVQVYRYGPPNVRVSAPGHLTAGVIAGAQQVTLDRLEVRVQPVGATSATPGILNASAAVTQSYIGANPFTRAVQDLGGVLPAFWPGWPVLIDDPTNGTPPEVKVVESVNYVTGVVRFTSTLANAYTTGSRVSTLLDVGNLRAAVTLAPFAQQTWNRTWADAVTGPVITPRYAGAIAMNNAGGITDRWALVFTSATAFNLVSERYGQIGAGNTASNFVPLNPLTSQPYFTLPASGWGTGWLPGNVLRFNTQGAHAGVWYGRCISPGAAGADEGGLIFRADV